MSTSALEKKDDDDSAKKDREKDNKDEKPRSLAAVKVALQLQYRCTKCERQMCKGEMVKAFVAVCRL